MGLFENMRGFLRTGTWSRSLQKYSAWEVMAPSWSMTDTEAFVRDGYRKNSLVYRCIDLVSAAVAEPDLLALQDTPEGEAELPEGDPLAKLLKRPSPDYGSQPRFVRQVVRRLLLAGEAIVYKVPGERTGRTVELQLLRSDRISIRRKSDGSKVYLYRPDLGKKPVKLSSEQVIFVKLDDPHDPDRGLAPLSAAARETDTDNEATDFRKAFFENGAMVSGILTTEKEATPQQLQDWTSMWRERYSGSKKAGKTPALAGGLSYQAVGTKPGEMAMGEFSGLSELGICRAFGVPPALAYAYLGIQRLTYSNYEQARKSLWEDAASPLLGLICDELTRSLTQENDGRRVGADKSKVPALQEDADKVAQRFSAALSDGAVTVNEYRRKLGLEPVDDGDVYFRPQNAVAVESLSEDGERDD